MIADVESAKLSPGHWPDLNLEALRQRGTLDRETSDKLHSISRNDLTTEDRTLYDLLDWTLQRRLEQFRLRMYLTPFWDDDRFISYPGVLGTASAPADASEEKLKTYPTYAAQATALLREGIQMRMLPSRDLVELFARSCSPDLPAGGSADPVRTKAQRAAEDFCAFLKNEYLAACPVSRSLTNWPNGTEVYKELARRYTTTDADPKDIHQFGLNEVARIRRAMTDVIARTGYKGSLDEFLKYARTNPDFYFKRGDDLLAAYRSTLDRIAPLVPKVVGYVSGRPLRVEPYDGEVAAMWHAPLPGHSEATIHVAVNKPETHPKFEIVPLLLHEGTPGHELQHAIADAIHHDEDDAISQFERNAGQNLAFAEGWALYAEGLGREMGLYQDPYDEFGELRMELTRAVRVVVDSGIHLDGWSEDRAKTYFMDQTGKPAEEVNAEISRTLFPGGQLAYKVGQSRISAMRAEAGRTLGPKFNVRAFHDNILRWGPLPLDILEAKLNDCLHTTSCAAGMTLN